MFTWILDDSHSNRQWQAESTVNRKLQVLTESDWQTSWLLIVSWTTHRNHSHPASDVIVTYHHDVDVMLLHIDVCAQR